VRAGTGCDPAGAQQVAVVATLTAVTLAPAEVPSGDVYVVLTLPKAAVAPSLSTAILQVGP
jgi:hypothetical protein